MFFLYTPPSADCHVGGISGENTHSSKDDAHHSEDEAWRQAEMPVAWASLQDAPWLPGTGSRFISENDMSEIVVLGNQCALF